MDGCYTDTNLIFLWNLEWDRLDISNKVDNEINISLYCLYLFPNLSIRSTFSILCSNAYGCTLCLKLTKIYLDFVMMHWCDACCEKGCVSNTRTSCWYPLFFMKLPVFLCYCGCSTLHNFLHLNHYIHWFILGHHHLPDIANEYKFVGGQGCFALWRCWCWWIHVSSSSLGSII